MTRLVLSLFVAILLSHAALAETRTCQGDFAPSMGADSGGFVVGDCTLYKTAKGAAKMLAKVSSACKENQACKVEVDAAKTCEAGACGWRVRKVISVEASAAAAPSASVDCRTNLTVYGISTRGSAICNPDWLDRPAAKRILNMAQSCKDQSDAEALTNQGILDFESDLKAKGKDSACEALDGLLKMME